MLSKNIDKDTIKSLIESGKTNSEIANILNIASATVSYWKKKLKKELSVKRYNWSEIQEAHYNGASYRDLRQMFGVTKRAIQIAKIRGEFETRIIPRLPRAEALMRKKIRARAALKRYNQAKKNQTPANEDMIAIQEFYKNCPTGYEVDHIISISKGGLHTLSNLQYLTISENRSKSNKIL